MTGMTAKSGESQRVHRETISAIAEDILTRYSNIEIAQIIDDSGIGGFLKSQNFKYKSVEDFLMRISTETSICLFLAFLEHLTDKRLFRGNTDISNGIARKYAEMLKFDQVAYHKGKWYHGPTEFQLSKGWEYWHGSDGEVYEYDGDEEIRHEYFVTLDKDDLHLLEGKKMFKEKDYTKKYVRAFVALHSIIPQGGFCNYDDFQNYLTKFDSKLFKDGNKAKCGFREWSRKLLTEVPRSVNKYKSGLITIRDGQGFEYWNKIPKSKN
jgi:hypothetical protein